MTTHNLYGYGNSAFAYNPNTGQFDLDANFDHTVDRIHICITDGDTHFDGDYYEGEVGDDSNQTAVITLPDGTSVASGQVYSEAYALLEGPNNTLIRIDRIEIDGVHYGYAVSEPLVPGTSYDIFDTNNVGDDVGDDDTRTHYSDLQSVPCFCQGTSLMTDQGQQPVDWIRPGDRIMTRDHGFQRALWVGRTVISANKLKSTPSLQPIRIAANSINAQTPARDLLLSPEHRVLLKSHQIELLFGIDEALAPIKSVKNGGEISQILPDHEISYYHILFDNHEIVLAEGLWVESFFPGKMALAALPAKTQTQIRGLLGVKADTMQTARLCLKPWEVKMLAPKNTAQALPCLSVA